MFSHRSDFGSDASCLLIANMPASAAQLAKRAFISVLLTLAVAYDIVVNVNRDSADGLVAEAFRQVSRKAHPDKGGRVADQQRLNAAKEAWDKARQQMPPPGRRPRGSQPRPRAPPRQAGGLAPAAAGHNAQDAKEYRINAAAILLTYQGVVGYEQWLRFVAFAKVNLKKWKAWRWSATLEASDDGYHIHLMLQFRSVVDRTTRGFYFEGVRPNARQTDLLDETLATKRFQVAVDRCMFYVFANKIGTVRDPHGHICVDGNYWPCWVSDGLMKYQVLGAWPEKLWKKRRLTHEVYEEYLWLCRDGVLPRKRNLEAVREHEAEEADEEEIAANVKRIRSNPLLYRPFAEVPAVKAWLALFETDMLRYPILAVLAPSLSGKTEFAKSLFKAPLELLP